MASDTKERILYKALEMFAERGYNGTNLRDLASELQLSKSALYRHYESKEEIWKAVQQMLGEYYREHFGSTENLPRIPASTDELWEMTMGMVNFTVNDETIVQLRKVLLVEQFRDESARKLASRHFLFDTAEMFLKIFKGMMENGSLKEGNPEFLALSYTAPITVLIHLCDREPDMKAFAMERLEAFVKEFIKEYGA